MSVKKPISKQEVLSKLRDVYFSILLCFGLPALGAAMNGTGVGLEIQPMELMGVGALLLLNVALYVRRAERAVRQWDRA